MGMNMMVMMMMDMFVLLITIGCCGGSSRSGNRNFRIDQTGLLAKLAASLMSSKVIETGKASLAAQTVELAQHVLMFGSMGGHVAFEVGPFAVQVLAADVAVHFVAVVAASDVFVAHLLVHERLGTARVCAFEGTALVVVVMMVLGVRISTNTVRRGGGFTGVVMMMAATTVIGICQHGCKMFLGYVSCQGGFRGELGRVAALPAAFDHAFHQVYCFQVFFEIRCRCKRGAAYRSTRHEPLTCA